MKQIQGQTIGYVRVSTTEQNTARQEDLMSQLKVDKIYIDKLSGKSTDRPQLQAMLDYVREGDVVIIESYSRLARSTKDLFDIIEKLNDKGVRLISKKENVDTSTPQGQFMLTVFAGLAELERKCILERQQEGIRLAKEQGKYKGRPMGEIENLDDYYEKWKNGEITVTRICKDLKISRSTFYRRAKWLDGEKLIDF